MPTGPSEHWIPAHAGMTPANWASFGVRKLQSGQSLPRIPVRLTHVLPTRPILRTSPHRSEVANEQLVRRDRVAGASAPARPEHRVPRKSNPASGPGSVAWPVPAKRGRARGRMLPARQGKGSACAGEVAPEADVPSPKPRSRGEAPASHKRGTTPLRGRSLAAPRHSRHRPPPPPAAPADRTLPPASYFPSHPAASLSAPPKEDRHDQPSQSLYRL